MECISHSVIERERLEKALGLLAALVTRDTAFLPFFLLFEEELQRLNATSAALDRALRLARGQAGGSDIVSIQSKMTPVPVVPWSHGPPEETRRFTRSS